MPEIPLPQSHDKPCNCHPRSVWWVCRPHLPQQGVVCLSYGALCGRMRHGYVHKATIAHALPPSHMHVYTLTTHIHTYTPVTHAHMWAQVHLPGAAAHCLCC